MEDENIGFILILLFILVIIIILILTIVNPRYPPPQPQPQPQPQVYGGCSGTIYGCCPKSTLARHDPSGSNC